MEVVRYLHLLAMAFFVGGQLMLGAIVVPVERSAGDRARMRVVARRFGYGTLAAGLNDDVHGQRGGVPTSGYMSLLFASHFETNQGRRIPSDPDGPRWGSGTLHVKLALVAAVGALILWHLRRPDLRALDGAIFLGSLAIVWLGVALAH